MCCLFGIIDPHLALSGKEKTRLIRALLKAAEARGTDASGIAYNAGGRLRILKKPLPGHLLRARIPDGVRCVMGHTRMTTQGSEKHNRNNHPFIGAVGNTRFALAHNGAIVNDRALRRKFRLPNTNIDTDSYIAVQLIEHYGGLSLDRLQKMAEAIDGSFCFTLLDDKDRLFFIKGDNPLEVRLLPESGCLVYASTETVLDAALKASGILNATWTLPVELHCGDIIGISANGDAEHLRFDPYASSGLGAYTSERNEYIELLKDYAVFAGLDEGTVDRLLELNFSLDEIEELLLSAGA